MHGGGTEDLDELLAKLNRYRQEKAPPTRTSDPRHLDRRLHRRRGQATGGQGRHRRDRRLPHPPINGPDTEPLDAKIRNLEWFAENVIAKTSDSVSRRRRRNGVDNGFRVFTDVGERQFRQTVATTVTRILAGAVMSGFGAVTNLWLAALGRHRAANADNVRCDPTCHGTWCPGDPITFPGCRNGANLGSQCLP